MRKTIDKKTLNEVGKEYKSDHQRPSRVTMSLKKASAERVCRDFLGMTEKKDQTSGAGWDAWPLSISAVK